MSENLDPRVAPIFRSRPKHERLLAHLLCSALAKLDCLDEALEAYEDREVNWSRPVFGRYTLLDFNGKTAAHLRREGHREADIQLVRDAYAAQGMQFPEGETVVLAPEDMPINGPQQPEPSQPSDSGSEDTGNPADGDGGDTEGSDTEPAQQQEPTFAGLALSALDGKSDAEMLKIEGIGKATLVKIHEARKARDGQ